MEELFAAVSEKISFPVDQVRYISLLLFSYPLGLLLRLLLHPRYVGVVVRHVYCVALGLLFGCICFGWQMLYLIAMVVIAYAILLLAPSTSVHWYSMAWAMGSVSAGHIYRMVTDPGGYSLDFTGPLMALVQRVSLIAFAIHDGMGREESALNDDQRKQQIKKIPSMLEYTSYNFSFLSFLAGPSYGYFDHLEFMTGENMKKLDNPNAYANAKEHSREPSPFFPAVTKFFVSMISVAIFIVLGMYVTFDKPIDNTISIAEQFLYIMGLSLMMRCRYYFIWVLVDSINNTAGNGFSGYDDKGVAQWDLTTTVDPMKFELGTSLRSQITQWNITTSIWYRRVCYERVKYYPMYATFFLSAWWHGFYPGYYVCFMYFGVCTGAARKVRRLLWHRFQSPRYVKIVYDILTWLLVSVVRDFAAIPFQYLWFHYIHQVWGRFLYLPQILVLAIVLFVPDKKSSSSARGATSSKPHKD